ncbi:coiled-coil domain-containing protein 74B [Poeciliopsis prolifica]|uniref:coiled-coil domain-containing protein 74B n=1 Tax=Poeciliopsis prolifica TaxID=188132 RepID=UPI0024131D5A|nr:coiled-coil domain-containing protein 74B [Poeciliopsis prolifica]
MAGKNLPSIHPSSFRTRFELSRKASSPRSRPSVTAVPALSLLVRGRGSHVSRLTDVDPQIISLQKNIQYLQRQQTETLQKLHAEMELLKRENKELKYRLTMDSNKAGKKGIMLSRIARSPCQGAQSGHCVEELPEDTAPQDQALREVSESPRSVRLNHGGELTGIRKTTLAPVRIHSGPSNLSHPSTVEECEAIIQHLFNVNSSQTQEIARLKALLSDIILRKKITREHQMLSKAYLGNEPCKPDEKKICPKLGSHLLPPIVPSHPGVGLPGLKQSLSASAANREKRVMSFHRPHFQQSLR